jgi:hypothetical protein
MNEIGLQGLPIQKEPPRYEGGNDRLILQPNADFPLILRTTRFGELGADLNDITMNSDFT